MRIIVMNHNYPPETASTGRLTHDIASRLVREGHVVTVVTGQPGYDTPLPSRPDVEFVDGVTVARVWNPWVPKRKLVRRGLRYLIYCVLEFVQAFRWPADLIIVMSQPPILNGLVGRLMARLRHLPYIYVAWDLNPDQAEATGVLPRGLLTAWLLAVDTKTMRTATRIVVPGDDIAHRIRDTRVVQERRILAIVPWLPSDVRPGGLESGPIGDVPASQFLVLYSGNVGLYYDLERVIGAAELLRDDSRIRIAIVGDGAMKGRLQSMTRRRELRNVSFNDYVPADKLMPLLRQADVHLVPLADSMLGISSPSKLAPIMAAGRAILAMVPDESDVARIVRAADCGIVLAHASPDAIATAIIQMASNPKLVEKWGENATKYYTRWLERDRALRTFATLVRELDVSTVRADALPDAKDA